MAKILLVHPLFLSKSPEERAFESPHFSLRILYLAGYVREQGHQAAIFDGSFQGDETTFDRAFSDESSDMVGIPELQDKRGIAFRDGNRVMMNEPRLQIEDLDTMSLPAQDLSDLEPYVDIWQETNGYSSHTIVTSIGCPYGCERCRDAVHGNVFRQRYLCQ